MQAAEMSGVTCNNEEYLYDSNKILSRDEWDESINNYPNLSGFSADLSGFSGNLSGSVIIMSVGIMTPSL